MKKCFHKKLFRSNKNIEESADKSIEESGDKSTEESGNKSIEESADKNTILPDLSSFNFLNVFSCFCIFIILMIT